jgi:hypothetical protein
MCLASGDWLEGWFKTSDRDQQFTLRNGVEKRMRLTHSIQCQYEYRITAA